MKNVKVYILVVIALIAVATISGCAAASKAQSTGAPARK